MIKFGVFALGLLAWVAVSAEAAADCGARSSALIKLLHAGDLDNGEHAVEDIAVARECGPTERRMARRALAEAMLARAKQLDSDPSQTDAATDLIEKAAGLKALWEASRELGDIETAQHDYVAAARTYQETIELIATDEDDASITRMPRSVLTYLQRRADETRHLAAAGESGTLVSALTGRDGNMGGVFSPVLDRGAVAVRVPAPILFAYNSDAFIPVGQQAAEELAKLLVERAPSTIIVTGHTDHIGSDTFNILLSRKRAQKVAEFLSLNGVAGTIEVIAKGKSEPRALSTPNTYSQSQIDELDRRVEFDWKP